MLVLGCALVATALAGCGGGSSKGGTSSNAETPKLPKAFAAAGAGSDLAITAEGGGVAVDTGDAKAAVSIPAGAVAAGATWKVVPLASAPSLAEKTLCPGIYVDTAGTEPSAPCAVGFSLPGTASPDACIVKLAEDGSIAQVMATTRVETGGRTLLTAYVDGFSAYTTAEEDAAARDKAFVDRAKAKGQQVDWTIKAGGTETQNNMGWKFEYELDLFASGGDVGMGGLYKGHGYLSIKGEYTENMGIVQGFGKISGIGRDEDLSFYIVDAPLADLLTGESVGDPIISGSGIMRGKGMASLNMSAVAPNVQGQYDKNNVEGDSPVPFKIEVAGEDVKIYIDNVGIFPGKILRTTK
ncbi:MAG: hypothetical protein CVT59_03270 [Actinobacteria bacterium HGW-Actinobacteria-1]|nr:MAG: hypothetical protein CVT59_03270 [Actinobacteria bacterium HGW-Actinobacteria-1]